VRELTEPPFADINFDATSKKYSSWTSSFRQTAGGKYGDIRLMLSETVDTDKQIILFNNATAGMYESGNANYVDPTSEFDLYLVHDVADVIVGIVFIQVGEHTTGA
jgi:hypothetical protein